MKKKLLKVGSGWALFMPKTIIELLKINPETDEVEIEIENNILKVKKVKQEEVK